ncbi:MAG: hypothetical protein OXC14_20795 [Rhodospirillaceae bacterium]|nr:hypothetical protein [Rhodospirillaceae bacterium]
MLTEWGEDAAADRDEYVAENVFWVLAEARWAHLGAQARQPALGLNVDQAMAAIERDNPTLTDVLPQDYARPTLDKRRPRSACDAWRKKARKVNAANVFAAAHADLRWRLQKERRSQFATSLIRSVAKMAALRAQSSARSACYQPVSQRHVSGTQPRRASIFLR